MTIKTFKLNNDYTFLYDENSPFIKEISYEGNAINLPKTLCKYYSLNKHNVEAIINNEIYASKTHELNDLFESCFEILDFQNLNEEEYIKLLKSVTIEQEDGFEKTIIEQKKHNAYLLEEYVKKLLKELNKLEFGFYCLTNENYDNSNQNNENELIWAHYTKNFGFKVEFDFKAFNNPNILGPFPIAYLKFLNKIELKNLLNSIDDLKFMMLLLSLIKKNIWEYEKEFRFICLTNAVEQKSQKFKINKKSILTITLSYNFFQGFEYKSNTDGKNKKIEFDLNLSNEKVKLNDDEKLNELKNNSSLIAKLLIYIIDNRIKIKTLAYEKESFNLIAVPSEIRHIIDWRFELTLFNL